jgi:hypothetical protein
MARRSPSDATKEPHKAVKMSKKGVAGVFLFVNILLNKKKRFTFAPRKDYATALSARICETNTKTISLWQ